MPMKTSLLFPLLMTVLLPLSSAAQDSTAYRIFTGAGKEISFAQMVQQISSAEVVFFGELHGNKVAHQLELELAQALHQQHPQLRLGLEMFEADNQLVLDEYLQGTIPEKHLLAEAKIWPNYATDYKPLIEFAKKEKLPVMATNIPRRYANLVYRQGLEALDSLSEEAKKWIAPLPIVVDLQLPGYQEMIRSMGGHGNPGSAENLVKAQAIKDATMAHFIILEQGQGTILHINGAYHSKNKEGIIWYLLQQRPDLKITSITTVEQQKLRKLNKENRGLADFIIVVQGKETTGNSTH